MALHVYLAFHAIRFRSQKYDRPAAQFLGTCPPLRAVGVCAVQARCPCDNSLAGADATPESVPVTYLPPSRSGGQVSRGTEAACVLTVIRVVDGEWDGACSTGPRQRIMPRAGTHLAVVVSWLVYSLS